MYPSAAILSITALLTASLSTALPTWPSWQRSWQPAAQTCLTAESAQYLVAGFSGLLTAFTIADANTYLADSFTDTSDSINFLIGAPLGSTTFPTKEAFIEGQGSQPPIGFTVLNIDAVTCDTIAFRWEAILGSGAPIKGINVIVATNSNGTSNGWQIETNYSEFNSATWAIEVGGSCTVPSEAKE
jgi:hypothetical protein